jgi:hypothetical protein
LGFRQITRLAWAVPAVLVGVLLLPAFALMLVIMPPLMVAEAAGSRTHHLGSALMKQLGVSMILLVLVGIAGLWVYSHVSPGDFGVCHVVPLTIGSTAAVKECVPYGPSDFAVAFGFGLILLVLALGLDVSFPTPFGQVTIQRRVARALTGIGGNIVSKESQF